MEARECSICQDSAYLASPTPARHGLGHGWAASLSTAAYAPGRLSHGPAARARPVAPATPDRRSLLARPPPQAVQPLCQRVEARRQCVDGLGVPPVALRQFAA